MKIFQRLFIKNKPTLKRIDIPNFEKVSEFIVWFIKNEPIANALNNPSNHIIFNEGYRPLLEVDDIPDLTDPKIDNILKWFAVKFFYDLNKLSSANKNEFKQFLDKLVEIGDTTLSTAGNIGIKYNVDFQKFMYEKEIEKIPKGNEREMFKVNYLTDNFIGAEIRIMAWLYYNYFGEWYQLRKK